MGIYRCREALGPERRRQAGPCCAVLLAAAGGRRADHNTARIGVRATIIGAISGRAAGKCRRQNERGA